MARQQILSTSTLIRNFNNHAEYCYTRYVATSHNVLCGKYYYRDVAVFIDSVNGVN